MLLIAGGLLAVLYACCALLGVIIRYLAHRSAASAGIYASSKGQASSGDSKSGKQHKQNILGMAFGSNML